MGHYKVKKCICHNKSFAEIKRYAEANGIEMVEELQEEDFCSCGCQKCVPYVELVLETGKTSFKLGEYY